VLHQTSKPSLCTEQHIPKPCCHNARDITLQTSSLVSPIQQTAAKQTNQLLLHLKVTYSSIQTSHTAEKAAASSVVPALLLRAAVPLLFTVVLPGHAPALTTDVLPLHFATQLLA
jgi:hypothetical protein